MEASRRRRTARRRHARAPVPHTRRPTAHTPAPHTAARQKSQRWHPPRDSWREGPRAGGPGTYPAAPRGAHPCQSSTPRAASRPRTRRRPQTRHERDVRVHATVRTAELVGALSQRTAALFVRSDGASVEVEKRVLVIALHGHVDLAVVGVHGKPRLVRAKAGVVGWRPIAWACGRCRAWPAARGRAPSSSILPT